MKERLLWIDSLKGILILLVIMGHAIAKVIGNDAANNDYWWCLIYSFHMPAFIAVSGYLQYRPKSTNKKPLSLQIWRRFCQLMVPFLVWSALFFAIRGRIESYIDCIQMPNTTFWFLWALFFICAIFAIIEKVSEKWNLKKDLIVGLTCVVCAAVLVVLKDIHFLGIQYILYYFIFYAIGYYIHKFRITIKSTTVCVLMAFAWLLLASFWRPQALPEFIPLTGIAATMLRFIYKFVVALVAVIVIFSVAPKCLKGENKVSGVLNWLGTYSLGIYVVHLTFADLVSKFVFSFVNDTWARVLILFVLLAVISSAIVWLLNKFKWTSRVFLGKI